MPLAGDIRDTRGVQVCVQLCGQLCGQLGQLETITKYTAS